MFDFVRKAFTFEHSALVPHSLGLAIVVQDVVNKVIRPKIQVVDVLLDIFSAEVIRGLVLTLIVFISGLGMYILVFTFDFITGLKASRREFLKQSKLTPTGTTESYIKSDKLWSSIWKFFAVITITFILLVTSWILVIIDQGTLHQGGLLIMLFFFIMVISFDFHSIGENQYRIFGKKPAFYSRMDWFFKKIGELLMLRIKTFFTGNSYEQPYDANQYNQPFNEENQDQPR